MVCRLPAPLRWVALGIAGFDDVYRVRNGVVDRHINSRKLPLTPAPIGSVL
jgi:hypothetical protein